jgi:DNA-binding NtrC family response regulator
MKRGATDFVSKPWSNERLLATVRTAASLRRSRRAVAVEKARVVAITDPAPGANTPLIGKSLAMARVHSLIARAAPTEANVLVLGENGTGKEIVARALHTQSLRARQPMLTVDLGAIATELIDSELFGHVKGAFTDARADRIGRMQAADGGTLFLDEVGNLPLHLQPKLLTALEQRRVVPVGGNKPVPIDIRVVAATNLPSERLADETRFRQDLLFRLNTVEINLPALRDRREDIPLLAAHFLAKSRARYRKQVSGFSPSAMQQMMQYPWPGNVRELEHTVERAVLLCRSDEIEPSNLAITSSRSSMQSFENMSIDEVEALLIRKVLRRCDGNISQAAEALGLSRAALYRRIEKYGL